MPPDNGAGAARPVAGKSLENCAVLYRETTDFDCHRMERSSFRAGVAPAEVQRLSRRTVTPIDRLAASSMPSAVAFSVAPSDLGR